MVNWKRWLPGLFEHSSGVDPGVYHYRQELDHKHMRLHLRVEENGDGILMVDASGVIHLNESGVLLTKMILEGKSSSEAFSAARRLYKVKEADLQKDYQKMMDMIDTLKNSEDACPIQHLNLAQRPLFKNSLSAPYRVDLALSYGCNNDCVHCYNQTRKEPRRLSEVQWKKVLEKLWSVGVPHVCFTGGEATLYEHLQSLIETAEDIGLVTGLLTNGRKLSNREYVHGLVAAGLDHVQITIESHDEAVHDNMVGCSGAFLETVEGIRNAVDQDLYLVTNTTLTQQNCNHVEQTLEFLAELGVRNVAMNCLIQTGKAPESKMELAPNEVEEILESVSATCTKLGLRFIWYSPTRYCELDPTQLNLGPKRCTAAEYSMCIEPDGEVIPCQSYYQPVGNILERQWSEIWQSELFTSIRSRQHVDTECSSCSEFDVCGGGCPLSDGSRFLCVDSKSEA